MKRNSMHGSICFALALALLLSGCASTNRATRQEPDRAGREEHEKVILGAGAGAVGGAVVGGVVGGKRGAVFGGMLGALAGGILGDYYDRKEKGLAETRQAHAEDAAVRDAKVKIESVRSTPAVAEPGDTIEIRLKYAVLTPREDMMVPVRETREILFEGSRVGEAVVDIEREGGTWRSKVPITLPRDARPGTYRVVASVRIPQGGIDVEEVAFRVR